MMGSNPNIPTPKLLSICKQNPEKSMSLTNEFCSFTGFEPTVEVDRMGFEPMIQFPLYGF